MNDPNGITATSPDGRKSTINLIPPNERQPQRIGRYRIESILGEGGFGRVYLAHDDQLNRVVAIKVPRPDRLSKPEDVAEYLTEARTVAGLDHPNIVPIFDVGTTPDGLCFVVSKVIVGSDLAKRIRQARMSYSQSAGLIATVADALHYAHRKGLVHRDIKPANILIDSDDKPYVADFGLALKEADFGKGSGFAGEEKATVSFKPVEDAAVATPLPIRTPASDPQPIKIVPKGLRSFDAGDADFFLELLPGPRDRDGLPDSIRFWKTRIETTDVDNTFSVGLIYGPSGCGKSSLVKAGLLPRLAKPVTVVYIEATAGETEARMLKGLRRQVPDLPGDLGLIESLAALRRGRFLESGQKVLLLLDQFEQWLHAKRNEENTELVQALRQCDGGRLQCVVMVRDDFWLAVSRFMAALEIVPDGENSRLVDLFDPRHAKNVLAAFGKAFGALPEGSIDKDQNAFLDQAVAAGLADPQAKGNSPGPGGTSAGGSGGGVERAPGEPATAVAVAMDADSPADG